MISKKHHGKLQRTHLEALEAVHLNRSVHAASRALGKAQPAVSRLIAEAEKLLGAPLFERSSQGMRETAAGEVAIAQARALLRGFERMDRRVEARRPIALGCVPRAMHAIMPALLERLHAGDSPAMQVKVQEGTSAELAAAVASGTLDFAIAGDDALARDDRLAVAPLYEERTVVIAGGRRKSGRGAASLAQLAHDKWVLPGPATASRAAFDRLIEASGLPPIIPVVEARSFEASLALVSGSAFLSIAPEPIARRIERLGGVKRVRLEREMPTTRIVLVCRPDAALDPSLEAFRALVAEVARGLLNGRAGAKRK